MTRKEMIESIAEQAGCSKRLVRKKLFELSAKFKRDKRYKNLRFNQAFLDKTTNWRDWNEVHDSWKKGELDDGYTPWRIPNLFEVAYFPTGCSVLFRVEVFDEEEHWLFPLIDYCGTRLYSFKGFVE